MTTTTHRAATLSVPYISSANFAAPTALSSITIQNIVGNYTSFTVTRTGGGLANYTSPVRNFPVNSFTDPTVLTNNSQYTYTITPVKGGSSGIAFTAIVNPNNAGSPGKIYTLATVSGLNPVYSGASSNISSVYITWSNNGYTTLYLANTTKGGGNYAASGTAYNSTTNGSSDSNLTTNTQYTYTFSCRNGDGYYAANSACQTTVNTCTWASCNAPTFSNTSLSGTTVTVTGLFTQIYITYSGGSASPASGTTVTGTNSISQAYTTMTNGSSYTFVCYPVNAVGYQSSNSASASVVPTSLNILTYTSSSTVSFPIATTASVLIVGGGGGGGGTSTLTGGGGGGGGAVGVGTLNFQAGITYTITIGIGGTGVPAGNGGGSSNKGGDSSIVGGTINEIARGGGYGGTSGANFGTASSGGCGGGAPSANIGTATTGSGTLIYYGYAGGSGGGQGGGGGGGGPTSAGGNGGAGAPVGFGGSGYTWSVTSTVYSGGGGGGSGNTSTPKTGSTGGGKGGNGGSTPSSPGQNATGYGGGGGGAGGVSGSNSGGNGYSGVVIIAY